MSGIPPEDKPSDPKVKAILTNRVLPQGANALLSTCDALSAIAARSLTASVPVNRAAKSSFLSGDRSAYAAGIVAILLGAALVFFLFPKKNSEERLLAEYHSQDTRHTGAAR